MKKIVFVMVLAMLQNCALASDHGSRLDKLGASLRYLRALPAGAKTSLRCPSNLEQLRGVSGAALAAALGKPDRVAAGEHAYYLSSPLATGQKASGYPVIVFDVKAGAVDRVACDYQK